MKVLTISVDVTNLTEDQIERLKTNLESQVETSYEDEAFVLNSGVNDLDPEELFKDEDFRH